MNSMLSAIYYPFSRCIDGSSLRQMLLVFDTLHFLDPVENEDWRAKLYRDLEFHEDEKFRQYRQLHAAMKLLLDEGALARLDPSEVRAKVGPAATASAISDLLDQDWVQLASSPGDFQLPHNTLAHDNGPTWQAFLPKLPLDFLEIIEGTSDLRHHVVCPGATPNASWTLSYAAGSAASTSLHLAAASQLGLAPITDSALHHKLVLRKLLRAQAADAGSRPLPEGLVKHLTNTLALALVSDLLPESQLRRISFDSLLKFRQETQSLRAEFVRTVGKRLATVKEALDEDHVRLIVAEIGQETEGALRQYRAELRSVRDKVWPSVVSAATSSLATGSVAAVGLAYIGGPGYALAGSIVGGSLALLKSGLDLRAERSKAQASAAPAISYLSTIKDLAS